MKIDFERYKQRFAAQAALNGHEQDYILKCLAYAKRLNDNQVPIIFDLQHFANLLGLEKTFLYKCATSSHKFYRTYEIPKANGGKRKISEPLPELKTIQKWIVENILTSIEPEPSCVAYRRKFSVKSGAKFHRNKRNVLKLDIKDFFQNTHKARVIKLFRNLGYAKKVSGILAGLTTDSNNGLPQGAPSSPYLSNILNKIIDRRIFGYCKKNGINYSRYSDDMTFSSNTELNTGKLVSIVGTVLSDYGYKLNHDKVRLMLPHQRQIVNGVVVNEKLQVPIDTRKFLRQEAYYISKFGLTDHLLRKQIKKDNYVSYLIGLSNYALSINPNDSNIKKYLEVFYSSQ